ncbi:hypothetical protein [Acetatifactor muris]|uniref:hypothetical protein n=1 Tax=Acetatifactor muris TaxID=879566 RepID=UPI0023F46243|nr:hypothetical protein [Acetatifactor muris]
MMKSKIAKSGPFVLLGLILLALVFLNAFWQDQWLDSDMAAEMIFSRLLAEEGHIFGTADWYYSTEFRVLYTQLVMTPLFSFMDSWHLIRMLTNVTAYVLMLLSYFYMMKPLKVRRSLTVLTGAILLLPFSETMITHMQMGNTYMVHVILLFFFFGMFLRLVKRAESHLVRMWVVRILYVLLAVVFGLSGVRYLLAMQCPLLIASVIYLMGSDEFQMFRRQFGNSQNWGKCWKSIWKSDKAVYLYYSLLGVLAAVAGYGVNVLWVSRKFVFQTYDATNFIAVYQGILWERVQNALGSLLMLFGYIPDKGFLSLRGLITLISFVLIGIFCYCGVRTWKNCKKSYGQHFFVVLFLAVALAVNVFVFVFTTSTMVPRYYITILIFALPMLAIYFGGEEPLLDRALTGMLLALCLCMSMAKVTLSFLTVDKNADKRAAAAYLEENGYDFGFATYWNANIVTELTDGKVEVGNILDPGSLEYFKWSSPVKYYEEAYHQGEVFLLLTAEEAQAYEEARALQNGEKVYEDGKYVIFVYENAHELMSFAE